VVGSIAVLVPAGLYFATGDDLYRALDKRQYNDVVQVEVLRENRRVKVPVRLLQDRSRGGNRRLDE